MARLSRLSLYRLAFGGGALSLFVACGGGGGSGGGFQGPPGIELEKPGGGTFFLDPHAGGSSSRFHLSEGVWGRLVDIHGLEPSGEVAHNRSAPAVIQVTGRARMLKVGYYT